MKFRFYKIVLFFIAMVYVFSTIGIPVIAHYCGGELEEVAVFSKPGSCCGDDDSEDDGCCKNETTHIAFQKDFTYKILIKNVKAPVLDLPVILSFTRPFLLTGKQTCFENSLINFHPPDLAQQSIVSTSVIRI